MNPWENKDLQPCKLIDIDYLEMMATVRTQHGQKTIPIDMNPTDVEEIINNNYFADTAFVKDDVMVAHSYLSVWNGTLTPTHEGGEVYE